MRPRRMEPTRHLAGDRPDEPHQLAGHRGRDLTLRLAGVIQIRVSGAQALLCRPANGLDSRRGPRSPCDSVRGLACGDTVAPGRFDQHPAHVTIAGLGDPPLWRRRAPEECSLGIGPTRPINCRGESKRVRSPSADSTVIATTRSTPRNAIGASTTGRNDQPSGAWRIRASRLATRFRTSITASTYSWNTTCCTGCANFCSSSQRRCRCVHPLQPWRTGLRFLPGEASRPGSRAETFPNLLNSCCPKGIPRTRERLLESLLRANKCHLLDRRTPQAGSNVPALAEPCTERLSRRGQTPPARVGHATAGTTCINGKVAPKRSRTC